MKEPVKEDVVTEDIGESEENKSDEQQVLIQNESENLGQMWIFEGFNKKLFCKNCKQSGHNQISCIEDPQ